MSLTPAVPAEPAGTAAAAIGAPSGSWRRWLFPAPEGPADAPPFSVLAWERTVRVMHTAFGALVVLAAVASVTQDNDRPERVPWAWAALAVLAVAYLVGGASGLGDRRPLRALAYLLVLVVVCPVLAWADPDLLFVLFVAYTQVWMMVEDWRPGLVWTLALAGTTTAGLLVGLTPGRGGVAAAVSGMAVGLAFSVFMGLFVATLLRQSQERADLIATLGTTRAELARVSHEAGVTAERERLAREVHDTLAQGYTSVVVLAQTARVELAAGRSDIVVERLAVIEDVARENLDEARAVVAAFSPPALDDTGLPEAVRRLATRHTRETGVPVHVEVGTFVAGDVTLRRDQEVVLLRSAQEALVNVRRHARASEVTVALCIEDGAAPRTGRNPGPRHVVLEVVDDGVGFDPALVGVGLTGLARRASEVGGSSEVTSRPGRGSRVTVRIPCD